ncbi:MAG: hypothetical protein Q9175_006210 [Cornicularia normoerica]
MKWGFPNHRQLTERWSQVFCGDVLPARDASHPLHLLARMLGKPAIASNITMYPKSWLIQGCKAWMNIGDSRFRRQIPVNVRQLANTLHRELKVAIGASSRLTIEDKESWSHQIRSCKQGPALTLLASVMQGIQSLVILDSVSVVKDLDPGSPRLSDTFSRLSYVETGSSRQGLYEDFSVIAQFAELSSIRSFRGLRLTDTKFAGLPSMRHFHAEGKVRLADKIIRWPSTNMNEYDTKSAITKLVLHDCALSTGSLHRILSSIQDLEEFTYTCHWPDGTKSYKYSGWGGRGQWEPRKIVQSLLEFARISLVSLDLTHLGEYCPQRGAYYSMGDMGDFSKLRNIRVEYMMFVEDAPDDRWSSRVHRLESVMPESLHYLSLAGPIFTKMDAGMVLDFLMEEEEEEGEEVETNEEAELGKELEGREKENVDVDVNEVLGSLLEHNDKDDKDDEDGEEGEENKKKQKKERKKKTNEKKKKREEKKRKRKEKEEGERREREAKEEKRRKKQKDEEDAFILEQRGFIPTLMDGEEGVPNLKEIIFENFDCDETLEQLLEPFKEAAEERGIRFCQAQHVLRPRLKRLVGEKEPTNEEESTNEEEPTNEEEHTDGEESVDEADYIDVDEKELMLVDVINTQPGRSYRIWAEVWKSPDPSIPQALVSELKRVSPDPTVSNFPFNAPASGPDTSMPQAIVSQHLMNYASPAASNQTSNPPLQGPPKTPLWRMESPASPTGSNPLGKAPLGETQNPVESSQISSSTAPSILLSELNASPPNESENLFEPQHTTVSPTPFGLLSESNAPLPDSDDDLSDAPENLVYPE